MIGLTIYALAKQTGADREAIKHWFIEEELKPIGRNTKGELYDEAKALEIINRRKRGPNKARANSDANIDPETGLTWFQLKTKEDALEKQRENRKQDAIDRKEWMEVTLHHQILSALVSKLEQVPGKVKSEQGLTEAQAIGLRRALDECRAGAAEEVRMMK